jgi:hypothetical protein
MQAATEIPGKGRASKCEASRRHSPKPLRFVWHHIQPKECGGPSDATNLVQLCDSCHYSTHRLLWNMARAVPVGPVPRKAQLELAERGFKACEAAGTVGKIPNEG